MPTQRTSSVSSQQSQFEIPRELQEVLLDFTVLYLIEQPGDLISFALDYFTNLSDARNGQNAAVSTALGGIRGLGLHRAAGSGGSGGGPFPGAFSRSGGGVGGHHHHQPNSMLLRPDQNHSEEDESMLSDDDVPNNGETSVFFVQSVII